MKLHISLLNCINSVNNKKACKLLHCKEHLLYWSQMQAQKTKGCDVTHLLYYLTFKVL